MNFASLFSGCGGFDIGFLDEGFKSLGAYDSDPDACNNFNSNIGELAITTDLTTGLVNEHILHNIDALIAGPPCQGFSTAGKRLLNDERNHLVTLTGELALRISPKVLVVENVPGALAGKHSKYWKQLDSMMRHSGYHTHTLHCQASDLGMPQMRKRILFFAWRTQNEIEFTTPKLQPGTIREAISNIRGVPNHKPKRLSPDSRDWKIAKHIKSGQKLSNVRGGKNSVSSWDIPEVFGHITEHERTVLELLRRLRRQNRKRDFGDADPVSIDRLEEALGSRFHNLTEQLIKKGYLRRIGDDIDLVGTFNGKYRRLSWDAPSLTVDTRFGAPRYFLHPQYHRGYTVREAARLQGFNDEYMFHGSDQAQYRVIGNAVPPPLGRLAAQLTKKLLGMY